MGHPSFVPCCAILEEVVNLLLCCINKDDAGLIQVRNELKGTEDRDAALSEEATREEAIVLALCTTRTQLHCR